MRHLIHCDCPGYSASHMLAATTSQQVGMGCGPFLHPILEDGCASRRLIPTSLRILLLMLCCRVCSFSFYPPWSSLVPSVDPGWSIFQNSFSLIAGSMKLTKPGFTWWQYGKIKYQRSEKGEQLCPQELQKKHCKSVIGDFLGFTRGLSVFLGEFWHSGLKRRLSKDVPVSYPFHLCT